MSKIDFKALVENLIFEVATIPNVPPGNWVYDLINEHENMFLGSTTTSDFNKKFDNCLSQIFRTPLRPSKNSVKPCLPLERIYDVFVQIAKTPTVYSNLKNLSKTTFFADSEVEKEGKRILQNIIQQQQWELGDPEVKYAYDALIAENELLAKAALETYFDKSIIETVNQVVKKRTDIFSRLSVIRNPFGSPFLNLIKDALLNPEQYASGNKKITGDFKQIVDDLYFNQVLKIGLTAKNLFKSKFPQQATNSTEYLKMLSNTLGGYTLKEIDSMGTEESLALIQALRDIAAYERKKAGRGERLKFAGQAASAITDFAGASLYGGPR